MTLAEQLHAAGVRVFPCDNKKRPTRKGWQDPLTPDAYEWPTGSVGVPVPAGVYLIDLDTYKGVTRAAVEAALGCALPWDAAHIQNTQKGGQHYAFRAPQWDPVQGSDNLGVTGFDSRAAGKGYFVTGDGYTPAGMLGVYALAYPDSLPPLPEETRATLERVTTTAAPSEHYGEQTVDTAQNITMLGHIDPGGSRPEWLQVGMALRAAYGDDADGTGLSLFESWSAGVFWPDGAPENYDPEVIEGQWSSFKAEGATTAASLYYRAVQGGWTPPASFDASGAFGPGAAPTDAFNDLVVRIMEQGSDARHVEDIMAAIRSAGCNETQAVLLRNELKAALRGAKILDKDLAAILDKQLTPNKAAPTPPPAPAQIPDGAVLSLDGLQVGRIARPETSHGDNAEAVISEIFGGRVATLHGMLRWWSGREWEPIDNETMTSILFNALRPGKATAQNVSGTHKAVIALADRLEVPPRDCRVYFRNTVLDARTGTQAPHNRANANTGTLQADFDPAAQCPQWHAFLSSIFGDQADGADRAALLQEVMGWAMIDDDLNVQKAIAFDGATRAGKGVILEVLSQLLGTGRAGVFTFSNLADGKTQSAMRSYNVVIDMEAKPPMRQVVQQAIGFLNKVASNESVEIPLLHTQTPWQGRLNTKVIIACNGMPTLIDDSGASSTRFVVLKFTRSFAEGEQDRELRSKLVGELPGVAMWAFEGCRRLIANGGRFTVPASSAEAGDDMRETNQPLKEFLSEYTEVGKGHRCHASDIWCAYKIWAMDTNTRLSTRNRFYASLRATLLGSTVERVKSISVNGKVSTGYTGMRIRLVEAPTAAGAFKPTVVGN